MADLYLGCLTYADDITLVSPSIAGLQRMLDMCTVYAKEHHLIFNSKKGVMITFKKKRYKQSHDPEVFLNDARLPNKDEIVHLGVVMNAHCAVESSLEVRKRKFYAAVNGVVTRLGGICSNGKGVHRGLGMRQRDSIAERLPGYIESAVKMKELQLKFLKRATQSRNGLVKGFAWLVCRYNYPGHGLDIAGGNIFALKYHELL